LHGTAPLVSFLTAWLVRLHVPTLLQSHVTSLYRQQQGSSALLATTKQYSSSPATRHGGAWGERRYSSYSFMTSALDGGEWSASRPGRVLPPGKGPPVPIVQEAGWAPETVWTQRIEEKSFAPAGDRNPDRPVVQPVVRHYTA
jgi:hypothetical protein